MKTAKTREVVNAIETGAKRAASVLAGIIELPNSSAHLPKAHGPQAKPRPAKHPAKLTLEVVAVPRSKSGPQAAVEPVVDKRCVPDDSPFEVQTASSSSRKEKISSPLTTEESVRFQQHEKTISEGLGAFVAVGLALMDIRDSRLYRATHATFELYVQSVLALTRTRAYQLIGSAQVVSDLSKILDISQLPSNEAQAAELRRWATPEEWVEKWKEVLAVTGSQNPTAKVVRQTLRSPSSPSVSSPETGFRELQTLTARLRRLAKNRPTEAEALEVIEHLVQLLSVPRSVEQ